MRALIVLAVMLLVYSTASAQEELPAGMAGSIGKNLSGSKFISVGDTVELEMDSALLAKGDRLDIYAEVKNFSGGEGTPRLGQLTRAGRLAVVSPQGEKPRGVVVSTEKEIENGAYIKFINNNSGAGKWFSPFIKIIADEFVRDPLGAPVKIVMTDMVNPVGDRTELSDTLFAAVRDGICSRSQFDCVDKAAAAEAMWKCGAATSRGLDEYALKYLRSSLKAAAAVNGYVRIEDGAADIAISVQPLATGGAKPLWIRVRAGAEEIGAEPVQGKVTMEFKKAARGRLYIRLQHSAALDGMRADFVEYKDVAEWLRDESQAGHGIVEASGFYVDVAGENSGAGAGGELYNGEVPAGRIPVTIGFYPAMTRNGAQTKLSREPVEKTVELNIPAGERVEVAVMGGVENGYAVIAASVSYPKAK